ncbi:MAG: class III signal peptide-containing protein [Candidatus Micrarchaeota archaeon]
MDEKAQVSAELIIIIAAVLAVAVVLIIQLQNTAEKGSKVLSNTTNKAFDEIAGIK